MKIRVNPSAFEKQNQIKQLQEQIEHSKGLLKQLAEQNHTMEATIATTQHLINEEKRIVQILDAQVLIKSTNNEKEARRLKDMTVRVAGLEESIEQFKTKCQLVRQQTQSTEEELKKANSNIAEEKKKLESINLMIDRAEENIEEMKEQDAKIRKKIVEVRREIEKREEEAKKIEQRLTSRL